MIPADLINRLQPPKTEQPAPVQAAVAAQKVDDLLSELQPGQQIQAKILTQQPNGTYRAMVAQREVTLALPHSAQPGDTLDLEVVDNDGKIALAVVAKQAEAPRDSAVTSTLSRAGQLIGNLLADLDGEGKRAAPAPLNGNTPLLEAAPKTAAELAPLLKDALTRSGMFYESHQAGWVQGNLSQETLLQEPQGRLSAPLPAASTPQAVDVDHSAQPDARSNVTTASANTAAAATPSTDHQDAEVRTVEAARTGQSYGIAPETTGIVRQQLEALATQTYAWQGQIWPGQQMDWEIVEDESRGNRDEGDETAGSWSTRLRLDFPNLGGLEARLYIRGGSQIDISIQAAGENAQNTLSQGADSLRRQFAEAGLRLLSLKIEHGDET